MSPLNSFVDLKDIFSQKRYSIHYSHRVPHNIPQTRNQIKWLGIPSFLTNCMTWTCHLTRLTLRLLTCIRSVCAYSVESAEELKETIWADLLGPRARAHNRSHCFLLAEFLAPTGDYHVKYSENNKWLNERHLTRRCISVLKHTGG